MAWVTLVVCDTDEGTICEFGNASAPKVVEGRIRNSFVSEAVFRIVGA